MRFKHQLALLALILALGLSLRLYRLGDRPLGFTWDEAALGYNAYSLLATGRDEYGQIAPLVFKSFGDYKPGLYIYLTVPPVAIFGLTEFSTRLPSAVSGTLLIALIYLLARQLIGPRPALFASLVTAINPWAVHFSRAAWEANLALTLAALAGLAFLRRRYLVSALFFGLTFWTYQGAKLFTPLLIVSLILIYRRSLRPKSLFLPLITLLVILLPIAAGFSSQSGRLKVFSVFSYTRPPDSVTEIQRQDSTSFKNLAYYLFHSEPLDQLRGIIQRYLNHLSPRFLFIEGDWSNSRQAPAPFYGNLHFPELLTLILGTIYIIRKLPDSGSKLLIAWVVLAPIPAALSRDIVSAVRSLPLVVPLSVISGLGLAKLFEKKLLLLFYSPVLLFSFFYFLDLYFIHSPHYTASGWLYPYKPALTLVQDNLDKYSRIVISDKLGQPYIFTLFYLGLDPAQFQGRFQFVGSPVGDVGAVTRFGKFEFRPIFWPQDRSSASTLFVGDMYELPEADLQSTPGLVRLGEVVPPDSHPAWRVVALP